MPQRNWEPDSAGTYWGSVHRDNADGVIFLTASGKFDFFAAVLNEIDIRKAIEDGMKLALREELNNPQVFTNGKLTGPDIDFGVRER